MNHPINPNNGSADPTPESVVKLVNLWFAVAVIGLFIFACFYVLKAAVDLFLPIVLAGFLGFLLTPVTKRLKKWGLSNFLAAARDARLFCYLELPFCRALRLSCEAGTRSTQLS